jgi:hypothetical protein
MASLYLSEGRNRQQGTFYSFYPKESATSIYKRMK